MRIPILPSALSDPLKAAFARLKNGKDKPATASREERDGGGGATESPKSSMPGKISDPRSRDSEITQHDLDWEPPLQEEDEKILWDLMEERVRAAYDAKREAENRAKESLRFYRGDQWGEIQATGQFRDLRDKKDLDRVYSVNNLVRRTARTHIAQALASRVSVSASPLTGRDLDKNSARIARSSLSHLEQILRDDAMTVRAIFNAHILGTTFCYDFFDPDAVVPIPTLDAAGEIIDIQDERAGEVGSEIVTGFDVYPDPKAKTWDECDWFIFARERTINYIVTKWGDKGWRVKPDHDSGGPAIIEKQVQQINDDYNKDAAATGKKKAVVYTCWEQPSPRFKKGRYFIMAGGVCLEESDWPYTEMKHPWRSDRFEFPFTPLEYDFGLETLWGDSCITPLKSIQRSYNRLISRLDEHTKNGDGKILAERGSNIGVDAFKSGRRNEIVYWSGPSTGGARIPPQYWENPPLDPTTVQFLQILSQDFDRIGETADVSRGEEPWAGAAAATVLALQDADASASSLPREGLKEFHITRARKRLALIRQYYKKPRLVMIQDTATDSPASTAFMDQPDTPEDAFGGPPSPAGQGVPPEAIQALLEAGATPEDLQSILGGQGQPGMPPEAPQLPAEGPPGSPMPPGAGEQFPPMPGGPPPGAVAGPAPGAAGPLGPVPGPVLPNIQALRDKERDVDSPSAAALDFTDFARGRYTLHAAVTTSRSPQQRVQTIIEMAKSGMFMPDQLPTTIVFLEMMDLESSDKLVQDMLIALRHIQQRQDRDAAAQGALDQQKLSGQLQIQQATGQQELQQKEMEGQQKLQLTAQTEQIKAEAQKEQQRIKTEAQVAADAQKVQTQSQGQMSVDANRHVLEMQQMGVEHEFEIEKTQHEMARDTALAEDDHARQAEAGQMDHERSFEAERAKAETAAAAERDKRSHELEVTRMQHEHEEKQGEREAETAKAVASQRAKQTPSKQRKARRK